MQPLQAHEKNLRQIFCDDYAFEIPIYQRPYAWELEQARDLLSDLLEALGEDGEGSYFLGSIVLVKEPNKPRAEVIDGQQRLTTLTILMCVLRDLTTDEETRRHRRGYVYQRGNPDERTQDKYRLLTRKQEQAFFRKCIQDDLATAGLPSTSELSGSRLRFIENAQHFRRELGELSEDRRNALMSFLITRCYLVSVEVPDADSARRIFVVMNSRGLDLKPTDILKAELLSRIDDDEKQAVAGERWEAIENALTRDVFTELFGHIRMIHERDKPRSALERAFPVVVPTFKEDVDFIGNVLEPAADRYDLVTSVERTRKRFGAKSAEAVAALLKVDNKDWIAPAMHKLAVCADHTEAGKFLERLERLAYQMFVTRADINERLSRYIGVLNEMDPEGMPVRKEGGRRGPFASKHGIELTEEEKADFLEDLKGDIYLKARVCKPLLEKLDLLLSAGGAVYESLSVEHVLPQKVEPNSEWAKIDESVRAQWTHKLGNLVLLTGRINSKARNWDFERKKRIYFASEDGTSPFPVTQAVLAEGEWTEAVLRKLQDKNVTILSKHWDLGA